MAHWQIYDIYHTKLMLECNFILLVSLFNKLQFENVLRSRLAAFSHSSYRRNGCDLQSAVSSRENDNKWTEQMGVQIADKSIVAFF